MLAFAAKAGGIISLARQTLTEYRAAEKSVSLVLK